MTWRALHRRSVATRRPVAAPPTGRVPLLRARPDRCLPCGARLPAGRRHRWAWRRQAAAVVLQLLCERCEQ